MAFGVFGAALLLVGAALLAVGPRPGAWSDESRAVAVIELAVAAALVVDVAVILRLAGKGPMSNRGRIIVVVAALIVSGGATALGVVLPFGLADWTRWLFVAIGAVALAFAVVMVAYILLPANVQRQAKTLRAVGAVTIIGLAATAVLAAVLVPDLPGWSRWVLATAAVALTTLSRLWKQTAWPDVVVVSLIATFVIAIGAEWITEPDAAPAPTKVAFTLPEDKVTVLEGVAAGSELVVIVVEPKTAADDEPISYESTPYPATATTQVVVGEAPSDVTVEIKRGADDANSAAFSADLVGATQIYVLSGGG